MIHLMKLEIQKNKIRTYTYASIIITITMIGLMYLFAYAPQIEPNDPDMFIFSGYDNVIRLYGVVNMAVFCIFSCVIYSHFIIEAYKGNQLILLFSYPTIIDIEINKNPIAILEKSIFLRLILSSLFCNIVFNSLANEMILLMFMIIALLLGTVVTILLMNKVNTLEVL